MKRRSVMARYRNWKQIFCKLWESVTAMGLPKKDQSNGTDFEQDIYLNLMDVLGVMIHKNHYEK